MLTAHLSPELLDSIDSIAAAYPTARLAAAAQKLSNSYRNGIPYQPSNELESIAYAAARMPATFASISIAFREIPFPVHSVLDLGAGTGAAAWAVHSVFGPSVELTCIERNEPNRELGRRLSPDGTRWRGGDFQNLSGIAPHDCGVFGYSLGELPPGIAAEVALNAFSLITKALVIVEPGTPASAGFVSSIRSTLIRAGARIAAPCPHSNDCPLQRPDWCHFAVRIARSRLQKQLKGGVAGFEDEKFSYIVALRPGVEADPAPFSRILRHPLVDKGSIRLQLCDSAGLSSRTVKSREKAAFRAARKSSWGDRWANVD